MCLYTGSKSYVANNFDYVNDALRLFKVMCRQIRITKHSVSEPVQACGYG